MSAGYNLSDPRTRGVPPQPQVEVDSHAPMRGVQKHMLAARKEYVGTDVRIFLWMYARVHLCIYTDA